MIPGRPTAPRADGTTVAADRPDTRHQAGWLPVGEDLERWIEGHRDRAANRSGPLHPVVQEFQRQLRTDPLLRPTRSREGLWITDVWAPLEGRVFNGGVRVFMQ